MRVLVACEYSGRVREAFRKLGHDAWSCDLLPSEDNSPYHIQDNVIPYLRPGIDLLIAHPPCTFLCNSGVRWLFEEEGRWEKMREGAEFFLSLWNAPIEKICIENPIMHSHAKKIVNLSPSQIIQPWMFGHAESKGTGLYLKNLPLLQPTHRSGGDFFLDESPKEIEHKVHRMPPGPDRWKERSRTYQFIADAMASQWGKDA